MDKFFSEKKKKNATKNQNCPIWMKFSALIKNWIGYFIGNFLDFIGGGVVSYIYALHHEHLKLVGWLQYLLKFYKEKFLYFSKNFVISAVNLSWNIAKIFQ